MYINFLTKIKNAKAAGKSFLKTPYSKMDESIAGILEKHKFLNKIEVKGRLPKRTIEVSLKKENGSSRRITGLKFMSLPSRKIYIGYKDIKPIKSGLGILVLTTPAGIVDGQEARKQKVGGQALFKIW
ncbi:MAG: 30S ribosomal protein S8 [Candidatus Brennerbacteria bacterium]|nr:30S ribosomal protein S8 [Candidatus Brennerbacteria bacterium]